MKVKLFNLLWYKIVKWLVPVNPSTLKVEQFYWRMTVQWYLALLFGGVQGVIAGDSNGAVMGTRKHMSRFNVIVVDWAIGGTTAHDWIFFLRTRRGHRILDKMLSVKQIYSMGGNYLIQDKMDLAKSGLALLHSMFPRSYNCLMPPINSALLSVSLGLHDEQYYNSRVKYLNEMIQDIWEGNTIDLYSMFVDGQGNAIPGALQDAVHYSDVAVSQIQKIFDVII